jgi:hypothetical protein
MALWPLVRIPRYGGCQALRRHRRRRQKRESASSKVRYMGPRYLTKSKRHRTASPALKKIPTESTFQDQRSFERKAMSRPTFGKSRITLIVLPVPNQKREHKRQAVLRPALAKDLTALVVIMTRNQTRNRRRPVMSPVFIREKTTPSFHQTFGSITAIDQKKVPKLPSLILTREQRQRTMIGDQSRLAIGCHSRLIPHHMHPPRRPTALRMPTMRYQKGSEGPTVPSLVLVQGRAGSKMPAVQYRRGAETLTRPSRCSAKTSTKPTRRTPHRIHRMPRLLSKLKLSKGKTMSTYQRQSGTRHLNTVKSSNHTTMSMYSRDVIRFLRRAHLPLHTLSRISSA